MAGERYAPRGDSAPGARSDAPLCTLAARSGSPHHRPACHGQPDHATGPRVVGRSTTPPSRPSASPLVVSWKFAASLPEERGCRASRLDDRDADGMGRTSRRAGGSQGAVMGKKLFVGNLSFETTSEGLREFFAGVGTVESA